MVVVLGEKRLLGIQLTDAERDEIISRSPKFCQSCRRPIPESRRRSIPGVRTCVTCEGKAEEEGEVEVFLTPSVLAALPEEQMTDDTGSGIARNN